MLEKGPEKKLVKGLKALEVTFIYQINLNKSKGKKIKSFRKWKILLSILAILRLWSNLIYC